MASLPPDPVFGDTVAIHAVGLRVYPVVHRGLIRVVVDDQNFTAQFRKVWRIVGWVAL